MRSVAYGEDAVYVDLEISEAPDRAVRTHAAAAALRARYPHADVVVGGGVVALHGVSPSRELVEAAHLASASRPSAVATGPVRRVTVVYDGPDLDPIARSLGLTPDELVRLHSAPEYVVELVGFLPGFAYMGPLDPRLVAPRRASPRAVVPACSVGIAGAFTAVYPFASPGGWNLIGRAIDIVPFDPQLADPSLFEPGDRVCFAPKDARDASAPVAGAFPSAAAAEGKVGARVVRVAAVSPGVTIQDAGRAGQLGRGMPPSGPLDPMGHAAANVAVGNPPGTAAIEVPLGKMEVVAERSVLVSIDGEPARRLSDGEHLEIAAASSAVRYVAVQGGIDVPLVLGARATLLVARLGGLGGRMLRSGDRLPVGKALVPSAEAEPPVPESSSMVRDAATLLEIDPGPHLARFPEEAWDALLRGTFRISRLGDRVGVRLEGDRVPREGADVALPVPMCRGAVQVSTDGTPIVLGPDHPVTGGYPVIAVVRRASQAVLARLRPDRLVRFVSA